MKIKELNLNKGFELIKTGEILGKNYYVVRNHNVNSYEVFFEKICVVSGMRLLSKNFEGYTHFIKYPSDEEFGRWAWCCNNINYVDVIINEVMVEAINRMKN